MPDWTKTMQQTFEYYIVDPGTWRDTRKINTVISSSITRDSTLETLGSASITIAESLGECYIRIYLITIQTLIIVYSFIISIMIQGKFFLFFR